MKRIPLFFIALFVPVLTLVMTQTVFAGNLYCSNSPCTLSTTIYPSNSITFPNTDVVFVASSSVDSYFLYEYNTNSVYGVNSYGYVSTDGQWLIATSSDVGSGCTIGRNFQTYALFPHHGTGFTGTAKLNYYWNTNDIDVVFSTTTSLVYFGNDYGCSFSGSVTTGGAITGYIPDYSTHIASINPASNTTIVPIGATSTSDFEMFELEYYNNTSSSTSTATIIQTTLINNDIDGFRYWKQIVPISGATTTNFIVAENVPFGNYDLNVIMLSSNYTLLDEASSTNITFGSSTNAITFADIYGASSSDLFDISQIATSSACGITDLTGCLKNAIVWAFFPTQNSISGYNSLLGLIQQKSPIGYFFIVKNSINNLNSSSTSAFSVTIPIHIKTYIFNPVDVGIASILWIYFVFTFYKRLKDLQI